LYGDIYVMENKNQSYNFHTLIFKTIEEVVVLIF
jgi:hypothetical protein